MATCLPKLVLLLLPLTQQMQGQWKQTFTGQSLPPTHIAGLMPTQNLVEKGREHQLDSWGPLCTLGSKRAAITLLRSHNLKEHLLHVPVLSETRSRSLTKHVKVQVLLLLSALNSCTGTPPSVPA